MIGRVLWFYCFIVCYIFILLPPSERRTCTLMFSNALNGSYARKMKNVLIPVYFSSSNFEEFAFSRYSDSTLTSHSPTSCHACAPASDPLPQIVAVPVQNTPVTWHFSRRPGRFICNHTFGFHAWCWHRDVQIHQRLLYLSLQLPAQQRALLYRILICETAVSHAYYYTESLLLGYDVT